MEIIYVYQDGVEYFRRSFAPTLSLKEAVKSLNIKMKHLRCIHDHDKTLLNGNTLLSTFKDDHPLVIYDDVHTKHSLKEFDKKSGLQVQSILYQSITGFPNVISRFFVELGRLGRTDSKSAWQEILPYNHYPNIKQRYRNQFSVDMRHKLCSFEILGPYNKSKCHVTISTDDTIGNLRKSIKMKRKFKCTDVLIFAATKTNQISGLFMFRISYINTFHFYHGSIYALNLQFRV